jgi:hypothetical protein
MRNVIWTFVVYIVGFLLLMVIIGLFRSCAHQAERLQEVKQKTESHESPQLRNNKGVIKIKVQTP